MRAGGAGTASKQCTLISSQGFAVLSVALGGMTGLIYPSVDPSLIPVDFPNEPWPIDLEHFKALAARIQALLGSERPVEPGTDLGPLRGKGRGTFGDFAWVNSWTPLLRESIWLGAKEAGLDLTGVPAELNFGKRPHEALIELEALPRVTLAGSLLPKKCALCGRLGLKRPEQLCLSAETFDSSIPLQRIAELPTALVVNERFAQFIRERKLRDVMLSPIELR